MAKCLFAIPNGGARHIGTAIKLKSEGVTAGVSDLFLMIPSGQKHGDRKSTRLNSSHSQQSRMPSSA